MHRSIDHSRNWETPKAAPAPPPKLNRRPNGHPSSHHHRLRIPTSKCLALLFFSTRPHPAQNAHHSMASTAAAGASSSYFPSRRSSSARLADGTLRIWGSTFLVDPIYTSFHFPPLHPTHKTAKATAPASEAKGVGSTSTSTQRRRQRQADEKEGYDYTGGGHDAHPGVAGMGTGTRGSVASASPAWMMTGTAGAVDTGGASSSRRLVRDPGLNRSCRLLLCPLQPG